MSRILVPNHSHWGAFSAVVEEGRVVGVEPFALDPDPSPLIPAIPDAVYSSLRIPSPMVRAGWREGGRGNGAGRGQQQERHQDYNCFLHSSTSLAILFLE